MLYIISIKMYAEFGGNKAAIIDYINEAYTLRDEVIGVIVR